MGILDKLRPQSKNSHPDPAIRLEAVHETDADDHAALAAFAKDDADPRVRRAAVSRVVEASVLSDIVRNESDAAVKDAAVAQLVERAAKHEPAQAGAAIEALIALGRERELAHLAKSAGPEALRRQAVEALADQKLLGSVARHAAESGARLLAVSRLTDPSELEGVAARGEHADAAVAAIDAIQAPTLDQLANLSQKARTKAAQKRARALARPLEPVVEPQGSLEVTYKEAEQEQARALVAQMTGLAGAADLGAAREGYGSARVAWVELLADADVDPAIIDTFERASSAVRERLAADDQARQEAERVRQEREREQGERAAVCSSVEALHGEDILDRLAEARATWEGLPPMPLLALVRVHDENDLVMPHRCVSSWV
jgi:hypothetical protein